MIGKHDAEGQNEQIISFEGFHSHSVSDRNPMCLGCDRVKKKNSMAGEKKGGCAFHVLRAFQVGCEIIG